MDTFASGEDLLRDLEGAGYDLIFLDVVLPGISGMEVLQQVKVRVPDTEVILITGHASIDHAVAAIKKGAFHYVEKPLRLEEIRNLTRKALDHKRLLRENRQLKARLEPLEGWGEMIGISPRMKEVFHVIRKVAPLDCNIIIQGESGTGKELVARLIHRESSRRDKPFVAFNCGGFTEELIGSELFGYERGAFTGAIATKIGILETANRGTVFMDEIGDMPLSMQGKLLPGHPGKDHYPGGRQPADPVGPEIHCGHQQGLEKGGSPRPVPGGPLFPAERGADRASRPHGTPRGYPLADSILPEPIQPEVRQEDFGVVTNPPGTCY